MSICFITVGLPGSGKSTWAKNTNLPIVSTDAIRFEFFNTELEQNHNKEVFSVAFARIKSYLKENQNVVFDATNLTRRNRRNVLKVVHSVNAEAIAVYFPIDVETCINRQCLRERRVPAKIIYQMNQRMTEPQLNEGFLSCFYSDNFLSSEVRKYEHLMKGLTTS